MRDTDLHVPGIFFLLSPIFPFLLLHLPTCTHSTVSFRDFSQEKIPLLASYRLFSSHRIRNRVVILPLLQCHRQIKLARQEEFAKLDGTTLFGRRYTKVMRSCSHGRVAKFKEPFSFPCFLESEKCEGYVIGHSFPCNSPGTQFVIDIFVA